MFALAEIYEVIQQETRPPAKRTILPSLEVLDRKPFFFAIRRRQNPDAKREFRPWRERHVLNDEKRLVYEEPN